VAAFDFRCASDEPRVWFFPFLTFHFTYAVNFNPDEPKRLALATPARNFSYK
jgi:hypothetical protein